MDKELCRTCIHSMYLGWGNMGAMLGCNHIGDTGISQMLLNEGLQPGERCRGYAPGKPRTRGMALKVKTSARATRKRQKKESMENKNELQRI